MATNQDTPAGVVYRLFLSLGVPHQLAEKLQKLAKENPNNPQTVIDFARSTDWHRQKYPGFLQFVRSGLGNSEGQYNQWERSIRQTLRQLGGGKQFGEAITPQHLEAWAFRGWTARDVAAKVGGFQWAKVNKPQVDYYTGHFGVGPEFSDKQIRQLGMQQSGAMNTVVGMRLQAAFQNAMQKAQAVFGGQVAGPGQNLGFINTPDIGA
jgi:hypothetical protein